MGAKLINKLAVLSMTLILAACGGEGARSPMVQAEPISFPEILGQDLQRSLARDLLNPEGARFRNGQAYKVTRQDGSIETVVCIEMNAQNALGAYTGYQKQLVVPFRGENGPNWQVRGFFKCPE